MKREPCDGLKRRWKWLKDSFKERFWAQVDRSDPKACWIWPCSRGSCGYGSVRYRNRTLAPHRIAYEFTKGAIPKGMMVCHTCDNRLCVNPDHLWIGDNRANQLDSVKKGRNFSRSGSANPMWGVRGEQHPSHKLTEKQICQIRQLYQAGEMQTDLAKYFHVTQGAISAIVCRRVWKHI